MKTKSVRYEGWNHRINGDVLEVGRTVGTCFDNPDDITWEWKPTSIKIGAVVVLASSENVSPNAIREGRDVPKYYLTSGPIPGNSNRDITRYHGWRGTSNDVSVCAHGERKILSMRELKNGDISVTVGPDLDTTQP